MAILSKESLEKVEEFLNNIPLYVAEGKIEERWCKTGDFWHPTLDAANKALRASARFRMDQIRAINIGEKKILMEGIKSRGIKKHVFILPNNYPNSIFDADLVDGNGRVICARTLEKNKEVDREIDVPAYIVNDIKLQRFVRSHLKEIQLLSNDHDPCTPTTKKTTLEQIRDELDPHYSKNKGKFDDKWLKSVVEQFYFLNKNNHTKRVIRSWVTEVKNTITQEASGIRSYIDKDYREKVIEKCAAKTASEKKHPTKNAKISCRRWQINTGTPSLIEKEFANAMLYKEKTGEECELVFWNNQPTSKETLIKSHLSNFAKIDRLHSMTKGPIFDRVYALEQVKGQNERFLTHEQTKKMKEKEDQNGIIKDKKYTSVLTGT